MAEQNYILQIQIPFSWNKLKMTCLFQGFKEYDQEQVVSGRDKKERIRCSPLNITPGQATCQPSSSGK